MKRIILIIVMAILTLLAFDASAEGAISRRGNTFVEAPNQSRKSEVIQTPYTWTAKDGKTYPVMMSKNTGSCFIIKVSKKTGKEYRQYLPKEVCAQICKEMGVEYKPKK